MTMREIIDSILHKAGLNRFFNRSMAGILLGLAAGVLSILSWSRVTIRIGHNPFWYGPILGLFVGLAISVGNGFTKKSGLYAVMISLIALIAGKYVNAGIEMNLKIPTDKVLEMITPLFDRDETIVAILANDMIQSRISDGERIPLPSPNAPFRKFPRNAYSPEIWKKAHQAWMSLPDSNRSKLREKMKPVEIEKQNNYLFKIRNALHYQYFKNAFQGMHLLYGFLTPVLAYAFPLLFEIRRNRKRNRAIV